MTAQIEEELTYQGARVAMCSTPLDDYFAMGGERPRFKSNCTALWRGYVGSWEIVDRRLYLVSLAGELEGGMQASLQSVFPGYPERVFAHWFSGEIRVPRGKRIEYVHMGYASTYERDLFLEFERGVLVNERVCINGVAPDEADGSDYQVLAMTVFPQSGPSSDEK